EVIKVEMQTLALLPYQRQFLPLPVPANPECLAGLDAGQHANQPFWNSVSSLNPASDLLFGLLRRTQIHKGSSSLLRQLFGPRLDACRQLLHERPEVLVQHPLARQKDIHPLPVTNRPQAPTKQDAIKTCYAPRDAVSVPCQKTLHDCPPYEVRQKHHAGNGHGASLLWLRPKAALRGSLVPPSCCPSLFWSHSAPLVLWESSRPWRSATSLLPRAGPWLQPAPCSSRRRSCPGGERGDRQSSVPADPTPSRASPTGRRIGGYDC